MDTPSTPIDPESLFLAKNRRLLVINADPSVQSEFQRILLGNPLAVGFQIDCALQCEEGIAMLAAAIDTRRPYAVAFIHMPSSTSEAGIKTIQDLWTRDPYLQIVICSDQPDVSWKWITGQFGQNDNLPIFKTPFDDCELLQIACMMTGKWNLADEARLQLQQIAIRESECKKLALLASRSSNGVVVTDALGKVDWVNAGFTRLTEFTLAEMHGKRPGELLQGPDTDPATVRILSETIKRGEGCCVEIVNYSKSGRKYWVEIELEAVHDDSGVLRYFMAIETDVTERRRTEEEKYRLANHIRLLLDSTGEGIYGVDIYGVVTFINQAAARMLGYAPAEVIGKCAHELLHHMNSDGTHYPVDQCPIFRCITHGENCRVETESFWRRDGSAIPVSYSAFQVIEKEEVAGAVITFADISARKEAEARLQNAMQAAESANQAKSEFLARMSHEIRTPLNGVVGIVELMKTTELDPNQRQYADLALQAADALNGVINDILDFSKIEAGKVEIEAVDFDLHKLITDVGLLLNPIAAKKNLTIHCCSQASVPQRVVGDPNRIRQVLTNLIANAIKFTVNGSVTVNASLEELAAEHCIVAVEVKDTGIGIPADRRDRLFKSFSQVDTSTTRKFGGTGLGLVISKRLVELMGGDITCSSEEGVGTTFRFNLKLELHREVNLASENPLPPPPTTASMMPVATRRGLHLLVAEDNAMNQFVISEMLKKSGCTCELVVDGSEAIRAWEAGRFDAVLMDCQMPVIDGLEATKLIREKEACDPSLPHTPIVALTAEAIDGDREKCLAAGMDGYVSKPINPTKLFAEIDAVLLQEAATA